MIFTLTIETSEEDLIRCICAAWELRYPNDPITPEQIKPFAFYDEIASQDLENILLGSSLGELASKSKVKMVRTG